MTLMSLAGIALISDHTHLVYQRDLLKAATAAASIAATRQWQRSYLHLPDAQAKAALDLVVRRYILANIPENRRERARDTLHLELTLNRSAGTVDVDAEADLGGVIFARWVDRLDGQGDLADMRTQAASKVERVGGITEVVLAIDVTGSMIRTLDGARGGWGQSRMAIVKRAARDLVDTLTAAGGDSVAIGLVPWNFLVRLDAATRTRWEDKGWAVYPTRHFYPNPSWESARGETHTLPPKPNAWQGCIERRDISGVNPPGFSTALPTASPFTMRYYSPTSELTSQSVSFQCYPDQTQAYCYHGTSRRLRRPQHFCQTSQRHVRIVPLTNDIDRIKRKISNLREHGGSTTYSTLGVIWGHRLLTPAWRGVWGDPIHPVDPAQQTGVQKVLVLLTDGEDNHIRGRPNDRTLAAHRDRACTAAKADGIKVFTIAAMNPRLVGRLAADLERCSSQADDPNGRYVFVNNATPAALRDAFRQIAAQLARFRRIY